MGATISLCRHFQGRLLVLSSGRQAFLMPDRLVVDAEATLAPGKQGGLTTKGRMNPSRRMMLGGMDSGPGPSDHL